MSPRTDERREPTQARRYRDDASGSERVGVTPYPDLVWSPTPELVDASNLSRFMDFVNARRGLKFAGYSELHDWSVQHLEDFWSDLSTFSGVRFHSKADAVLTTREMPAGRWFPGGTLNYAEHVLTDAPGRAPQDVAVVFCREDGTEITVTHEQLRHEVGRARVGLQHLGVGVGDRVVAYAPNAIETMVFFLAAASLGATWSCCSPEFGTQAVIDRFAQIEPVVMLAFDGYLYGGKTYDVSATVNELLRRLPTLRATIVVPQIDRAQAVTEAVAWTDFIEVESVLEFEPVPFDHPLWILYSSGTTGVPKAIVHGHGGIVLDHIKALGLHLDLKPGDRFMWYSTTGWMMWNYLLAGLLVGASIVIYDGNPGYPDVGVQWQLVERHKVTFFGMSAAFVHASMGQGIVPREQFDLSSLKGIGSTGSPLSASGYRWLHDAVAPALPICSISGGTDLCAAFIGTAPMVPVWTGELSCAWLGAAVAAYDSSGSPVVDEIGELVLTQPMPSMPVYFWNDPDGSKLRKAYFEDFPGVWRHGDWIRQTVRGSFIISGRSDSTLNRGGVRMGTAEFYAVVEGFDEVSDSLVIDTGAPDGPDDGTLLCFVVPAPGVTLEQIEPDLRAALRAQLSPRHVPDRFIAIEAVPRTLTGKKSEVPVKRILAGADPDTVVSRDALANPEALDAFLAMATTTGPRLRRHMEA